MNDAVYIWHDDVEILLVGQGLAGVTPRGPKKVDLPNVLCKNIPSALRFRSPLHDLRLEFLVLRIICASGF